MPYKQTPGFPDWREVDLWGSLGNLGEVIVLLRTEIEYLESEIEAGKDADMKEQLANREALLKMAEVIYWTVDEIGITTFLLILSTVPGLHQPIAIADLWLKSAYIYEVLRKAMEQTDGGKPGGKLVPTHKISFTPPSGTKSPNGSYTDGYMLKPPSDRTGGRSVPHEAMRDESEEIQRSAEEAHEAIQEFYESMEIASTLLADFAYSLGKGEASVRSLRASLSGGMLKLIEGMIGPELGPFAPLASSFIQGLWERMFSPEAKPELHMHQEIVINIGEGMISEKAFWDNLVHYYILPGLERKGFIPVKVGGKG